MVKRKKDEKVRKMVTKRNVMLSGEVLIINLINQKCRYMRWLNFQGHIVMLKIKKIELDFSNYARKSDIKSATGISRFSKKADSASLKSDVGKLDIDKLETIPADLNKLSNILINNVIKKAVYAELVIKVNAIQTINTSDLVKKVQCSTKIDKIENKIPNQDKYVTNPELNKLTKENSTERLKQANLAIKNGIVDFVEK